MRNEDNVKRCRALVVLIAICVVPSGYADAKSGEYENLTSIESIETLISSNNNISIDELLEDLPTKMRKQYTLVYRTRGRGKASFQYPRVILSGLRNYLTVSFDTDPTSPLYESLELMEYDQRTSRFHFKEISFDPRKPASNPQVCLSCHEKKKMRLATPIWDLYPMWPGVYGSVHDQHTFRSDVKENEQIAYSVKREQEAYDKYIALQINQQVPTSRLAYLLPIWQLDEQWRFRSGMAISQNLEQLSNLSNLRAFQGKVGKKWHRAKYFLYYATSCISENRDLKKTSDNLLDELKTYASDAQLFELLGDVKRKKTLEKLNRMVNFVRKKIDEKQGYVFHRLCEDILDRQENAACQREMRQILGPADESEKEYYEQYGSKKFGFLDLRSQWPHIATLKVFFDRFQFPYEEWVHDFSHDPKRGVALSYYNNNSNGPHGLNDALPIVFGKGDVNPVLDQKIIDFYAEYLRDPMGPKDYVVWPFISDQPVSIVASIEKTFLGEALYQARLDAFQAKKREICESVRQQSLATFF